MNHAERNSRDVLKRNGYQMVKNEDGSYVIGLSKAGSSDTKVYTALSLIMVIIAIPVLLYGMVKVFLIQLLFFVSILLASGGQSSKGGTTLEITNGKISFTDASKKVSHFTLENISGIRA